MLALSFLIVWLARGRFIIGNAAMVRLDPWHYFDRPGDQAVMAIWIGVLGLANLFLAVSLFGPFVIPSHYAIVYI